ncbi:HalOD1 output domain-containing protein [Haladaptatus sp. NG-WS-4]
MDLPDEHDATDDPRLSIRVVQAIAEFEETNPTEVRPILYDIVDPDALDTLFEETHLGKSRTSGYVAFEYGPHEVVVYSDGDVEVVEGGAEPSPSSSESTSKDD